MSHQDLLSLTLPAEPENVAVVRRAVEQRAEELGMREAAVGDLKTVVTEACGNVVRHAYPDAEEPGSLEVEMTQDDGALKLVVRDRGGGIRPHPEQSGSGLRMGLLLIGALSSCFQLSSHRGRGTQLSMQLPLTA